MVVQEMTANEWSEIFTTTEKETSYNNVILINNKMRKELTIVSLMSFAHKNVKLVIYFLRRLHIGFFALEIMHILKRKRNRKKRTSKQS